MFVRKLGALAILNFLITSHPRQTTMARAGAGMATVSVADLTLTQITPESSGHTARAKRPQRPMGTISGKVFLITQGGDIKPARLAEVTLLYGGRSDSEYESTAEKAWFTNLKKGMDAENTEMMLKALCGTKG